MPSAAERSASMRRFLILVCTLFVVSAAARAADRQWQTGKWAQPMVVPRVGTPYRNYAIETDLFRLDLQETIARGRLAITATPGTPVTFAIEEKTIYVRDGDAERALRLIKRTEKLKSYSANGGGHYIKALADAGLTITLEDGSIWEIDPRGQYRSSQWQVEQGMSVRPTPEDNGFNYELANTDVDEAVLARLAR
jgi:hypothetical protein